MSLGYAEKLSYIEDVGNVGMSEFFDPPHVLQEKGKSGIGNTHQDYDPDTSWARLQLPMPKSVSLGVGGHIRPAPPYFSHSLPRKTLTIERLAMMIKKSKHLVVFTGAGISTSCGIPDFRGPRGIWTLQREGKSLPEASLPFHRAMPSMTHMALVELEKAGLLKFVISQNIDGLHLRSGIPREKLAELHGNSFMETCPSCGVEYLRDFEVETIGLKETSRRCSTADCTAKLKDTVLDWEKTPKDKKASLVVHALVDKVIAGVMDILHLWIRPFVRIDLVQTIFTPTLSSDKKYVNWTLTVASVHGKKAPLPFIKSVEISFSSSQNMKAAVLHKQPLQLKRRTVRTSNPFNILLKLNFSDGCGCSSSQIKIPVNFKVSTDSFKHDTDSIFQKLKEKAIQDPCCGQTAIIDRNVIMAPKSELMVHAIVTNVLEYDTSCKASEASPLSNGALKRRNGVLNELKTSWKRHLTTPAGIINSSNADRLRETASTARRRLQTGSIHPFRQPDQNHERRPPASRQDHRGHQGLRPGMHGLVHQLHHQRGKCHRGRRKTITSEDILYSMHTLGFENYIEPLITYHNRYRQHETERTSRRNEPLVDRIEDYGQAQFM
ncbi:hypothetical protein RJ639_007887 [Escallonia herrerae]|uniref:protein acetyllysine N-acetyltransferase n=1 Tax=Escallonia herrerae TaxID=1293975 RepID=A0AA89ASW7_9ASTE|nr:hypothetical protein RJ639_007887 [Escallonia herrerae]